MIRGEATVIIYADTEEQLEQAVANLNRDTMPIVVVRDVHQSTLHSHLECGE